MKTALSLIPALTAFVLLSSCHGKNTNYGTTYGAPKATITKEAAAGNRIQGPVAYAPAVPAAENSDHVSVRIDVQHKKIFVDEGVGYNAWVFGDSMPGPVIHVRMGQTVDFTLHNSSDQTGQFTPPMPHSIDIHAAMVNPADKYQSINPGETIHFQFTPNYPGVFMYHCGTPVILQHMISGMIGMVIVDPKDGFPGKVDKEFALVQSEVYLKKENDSVYSTDISAAKLRQPTYVTFNGKYKQYMQHPLQVKAGDRVRLYVLNAGPNLPSSFHVVGTLFDKVWLDGNPANELRGMQTILLGSSNSAIVEFVVPEKGTYAFVDHDFASVETGAIGLIHAE